MQKRIETGAGNNASKANVQRINEMIRTPQVRVISDDGEQLGIMSVADAIARARGSGLDLVEVAAESKPPVCRIMDFGKYKYQQKKRATKQQTGRSQVKELRLRPKTGEHDIMVKVNKAKEFLTKKDKVMITVMFRGRELAHIDEGEKLLASVLEQLEPLSKVESPPKSMGKRIICTIAPK